MSTVPDSRLSRVYETLLRHKSVIIFSLVVATIVLPTMGFCNTPGDASQGLDTMADSLTKTIFSPWVKKTILVFGAGFGIVKSVMGGGWLPLVSWGGLGLAINFLPKLIEFITKMA